MKLSSLVLKSKKLYVLIILPWTNCFPFQLSNFIIRWHPYQHRELGLYFHFHQSYNDER